VNLSCIFQRFWPAGCWTLGSVL